MRSDENQKTATLGGILAEEIHKTPGKRLAGDDCNTTARPLPGPPARLSPKTPAGPLPGPHQPSLHRRSHAAASPNQLGRHLCGDGRPLRQLNKHLRGGMQIFMKALPPRHLSCLPAYMAPHASLAQARVEARQSGDGRDGSRSRPR